MASSKSSSPSYRRHFALLIFLVLHVSYAANPAVAKDAIVSQNTTQLLSNLSIALAELSEASRPAIVNISTTSTITMEENPFGDMFNDPFFRRFFGDPFNHQSPQRKHKSSALGSGVIVGSEGYILTNNHVIKGADEIQVALNDKREFIGKVVGTDPKTDLAVIKIAAKNLPSLKLGDSAKLKTGDIVVAIGNPFGLNQTITMGIVSAVGRSNVGIADFEDFIQTDAAINPGNSGGALVNSSGELVGINTAIFSTSGGYMGIGFAIPSNMAKSVMDSIINTGKVVRGWMGVNIQNLTPDLADSLGIKGREGALISGVEKDSPADKAGFKRGDLIIELNGKKVVDSTGLRNMVAATPPGTMVDLKIIRVGKEQILTITLGESRDTKKVQTAKHDSTLQGVAVQELSPGMRDRLSIPADVNGVVVSSINQDSPARGRLQVNDVIQEIGRQIVQSTEDFDKVVSGFKDKETVLLLIYRNGGSLYITIKPK